MSCDARWAITSRFHHPGSALGCSQVCGIGVLDGPAEPLSLRMRDAEQRGAVQAHGAESYSTGHARSAHLPIRAAGRRPADGRDRAIHRVRAPARRRTQDPAVPRRDEDGRRCREGDRVRRGADREVAGLHGGRAAGDRVHVGGEPRGPLEAAPGSRARPRRAGRPPRRRAPPPASPSAARRPSVTPRPSAPSSTPHCLRSRRSGPLRGHPTPCSRSRRRTSSGRPERRPRISSRDDGDRG